MTPERQRIAEAISPEGQRGHPLDERGEEVQPPDYLHDLNAMHEAEKSLNEKQQEEYFYELFGVCGIDPTEPAAPVLIFKALHATAAQRREAFLRTIGKWEE